MDPQLPTFQYRADPTSDQQALQQVSTLAGVTAGQLGASVLSWKCRPEIARSNSVPHACHMLVNFTRCEFLLSHGWKCMRMLSLGPLNSALVRAHAHLLSDSMHAWQAFCMRVCLCLFWSGA